MKTLIIHEAWHLRQGVFTALSVYGELEVRQLEFSIYRYIKGRYPNKVIDKLMKLPLKNDRDILKQAVQFMYKYAGKGYRANLLPLFPWGENYDISSLENNIVSSEGSRNLSD